MLLRTHSDFKKPFIITGGPGAGKTTLINTLANMGASAFDEVSRSLIERELKSENPILPWTDLPSFADMCFREMDAQLHESQNNNQLTFLDRAIPDIVAYLRLGNEPHLADSLVVPSGYQPTVFLCRPEKAIYSIDDVRPHPFAEALEIHELLTNTYCQAGFRVLEVPWGPPAARADWVMSEVGATIPEGV